MVPKAVVEIEGEKFTFILDLQAMRVFKEKTGKDLLKGEMPSETEDIIAFLHACLLRCHPDLSEEDVGHLVHPGNLAGIMDDLGKMYADSMPEGGEDEGGN